MRRLVVDRVMLELALRALATRGDTITIVVPPALPEPVLITRGAPCPELTGGKSRKGKGERKRTAWRVR